MTHALRLQDVVEKYRPLLVRDRAGLLDEIDAAWSSLDGIVRELTADRWHAVIPGAGEGAETWTVKDAVAHLAAWKRNAARAAALQASRSRHVHAFPGMVLGFRTAEFNEQLLRDWRDRPVDAVLAEHRAAHAALLSAVEGVPDRLLVRRKRSPLWLTPALGHTHDHLAQLRRAL